jgi:hypothetical protein
MEAATVSAFPHDRVCHWYDELTRVAAQLPSLAPEARRAVRTVLVSFRADAQAELTGPQARTLDEVLAALARGA